MKFYFVLNYTLPSKWPKSTQAEIQNDGGSLGFVISLRTRSRLIKRESLIFSLRQYYFHIYFQPLLLNQKQKWYMFKTHNIIHSCQM